ncbi:MAG: hypothetical protein ABID87_01400 [Chloroflexota bacterium]
MEMRDCGRKVGAHFTRFFGSAICRVRRSSSSWAESSFLPPCRAISTEKVSPRRAKTLSRTARATSRW